MRAPTSFLLLALLGLGLSSCVPQDDINLIGSASPKTGVPYGQPIGESSEAFEPFQYPGQETAPGLLFIEGGSFIMGGAEQDIAFAHDNHERQVTVHSFYMDETEVTNINWKEFLFYIKQDSGEDKYIDLLPDTMVWFRDLAYNDPYVQYYYSHAGFNTYPVVGVNWHQANEYCDWRTASVNGEILKLYGEEEVDPSTLFPNYRLPTEAEWEYAARGLLEQELYPWIGRNIRDLRGRFQANFKRGRGDYAGRSNAGGSQLVEGLNDMYMIPAPVREYFPNDFGLYCMAGNVAEWTLDTYRKMAYEDNEDLNPFRRSGTVNHPNNYFKAQIQEDRTGGIKYDYRRGNSILFNPDANSNTDRTDFAKVYRGGAWSDVAYYISTGTRRWCHSDSSTSWIGFRSAMFRVGSPF